MTTREIIKMLCEKRGISVSKLETDLGFSNGSIMKYEYMKSDRLHAIAKYFGVSMEFLMGAEGIYIDEETHTWEVDQDYYADLQAKLYADFLKKKPEYKMLFDASIDVSEDELETAAKILQALKKRDGEID